MQKPASAGVGRRWGIFRRPRILPKISQGRIHRISSAAIVWPYLLWKSATFCDTPIPPKALIVYDHGLERIREAEISAPTQRDEAELLAASSYALRWTGRENEAKQRITRALELLSQAGRYPADKIEPMSDVYDALRAQADDYAQTGQTAKAVEAYQQLLDKLMAWKADPQNDLRDATCISRTWTALADLLRRSGQKDKAQQFEAQREKLWNHWKEKLPNAQFLLSQSLSQITPPPAFRP